MAAGLRAEAGRQAGGESDLASPAGELAGLAGAGGRAEVRRWRGCPEGWPASLAGAGSPALELSSRFSELRLGLPGQPSSASLSRLGERAIAHPGPRSVATGFGLTLADRGARFRRLPRGPLISERHSRNLKNILLVP